MSCRFMCEEGEEGNVVSDDEEAAVDELKRTDDDEEEELQSQRGEVSVARVLE